MNDDVSNLLKRIGRHNPLPVFGSLMNFGSALFDSDNVQTSNRGLTGHERIQQYFSKQDDNTERMVRAGMDVLSSILSMIF